MSSAKRDGKGRGKRDEQQGQASAGINVVAAMGGGALPVDEY